MKAYTQFVIKMFECLSELYQADEKRMKIIFSEGKDFLTYSHHQEYSVLQNEYARLFVSIIQSHAELFHINNQQYQLEQSGIFSDEVKIIHSCYPKISDAGYPVRSDEENAEQNFVSWCGAMQLDGMGLPTVRKIGWKNAGNACG